jgi:hypothetical protein
MASRAPSARRGSYTIKELGFWSRGEIAEAASFVLALQVVVIMRSLVLGHLLGLENTLVFDDEGGAPSTSSTFHRAPLTL